MDTFNIKLSIYVFSFLPLIKSTSYWWKPFSTMVHLKPQIHNVCKEWRKLKP